MTARLPAVTPPGSFLDINRSRCKARQARKTRKVKCYNARVPATRRRAARPIAILAMVVIVVAASFLLKRPRQEFRFLDEYPHIETSASVLHTPAGIHLVQYSLVFRPQDTQSVRFAMKSNLSTARGWELFEVNSGRLEFSHGESYASYISAKIYPTITWGERKRLPIEDGGCVVMYCLEPSTPLERLRFWWDNR